MKYVEASKFGGPLVLRVVGKETPGPGDAAMASSTHESSDSGIEKQVQLATSLFVGAEGIDRLASPVMNVEPVGAIFKMRESSTKRGLARSRSTLLDQRGGALADFLERHFKVTKLFRA
jgi:hypothetical protein